MDRTQQLVSLARLEELGDDMRMHGPLLAATITVALMVFTIGVGRVVAEPGASGSAVFTYSMELDTYYPQSAPISDIWFIDASDPRASGLLVHKEQTETWDPSDDESVRMGIGLSTHAFRLTNDGGGWSGTGSSLYVAEHLTGSGEPVMDSDMIMLSGEGSYEGLSLIMAKPTDSDPNVDWGVIVPADAQPGDLELAGGSAQASATDRTLDTLSDAESFGVFVGHVVGRGPSLVALRNEPHMIPEGGPARDWLAELAADPDAFAEYLALSDRLLTWFENELAWMEAHPPRPCFAATHEAVMDMYGEFAATWQDFVSAMRAQDGARFGKAYLELKVLDARVFPDPFSSGVTCWTLLD